MVPWINIIHFNSNLIYNEVLSSISYNSQFVRQFFIIFSFLALNVFLFLGQNTVLGPYFRRRRAHLSHHKWLRVTQTYRAERSAVQSVEWDHLKIDFCLGGWVLNGKWPRWVTGWMAGCSPGGRTQSHIRSVFDIYTLIRCFVAAGHFCSTPGCWTRELILSNVL